MQPAYEVIGDYLSQRVPTVFGLMGDANMRYLARYIDGPGRFVTSVHESGAVSMADGYARASGDLGVASVTHGPAVTNTVTALTEAAQFGTPLVVLTGSTRPGKNVFQNIDLAAVIAPTGAMYQRIESVEALMSGLDEAFETAQREQLPVVCDIPIWVESDTLDHNAVRSPAQPITRPVPSPAGNDVAHIGRVIDELTHPVIVVGRGALAAETRSEIGLLAEHLGAPIVTTLLAREAFADHTHGAGIMGGLSFGPVIDTLCDADGFIVFGAGLNTFTAGDRMDLIGDRTVIQIDTDPAAFHNSVRTDHPVVGDAGAVAAVLRDVIAPCPDRNAAVVATCQRIRVFDPRQHYAHTWEGYGLSIREAALELQQRLPGDIYVASDLGRFIATSWRHIYGSAPGAFTHTGTFGSIGLGLSTALGAALGTSRSVVALLGDGGLMMHAGELSTAAREKIAVTGIVFNDGAYGAEYSKLAGYGLDPEKSLMQWPDLAGLARQLGWHAQTVTSVDEIRALEIKDHPQEPLLIDVRVDPRIEHFEW